MRKTILVISIMALTFCSFGQITEKQFIEKIEWLNENPSTSENTEFVSNSVDILEFQFLNFPNTPINVSGTKELEKGWHNYKYEKYFIIVYSFNQLYYKIRNKKYDNLNACVFSIKKLIKSYTIITENEPELKIETFEEYKKMSDKELKKRIKKLL